MACPESDESKEARGELDIEGQMNVLRPCDGQVLSAVRFTWKHRLFGGPSAECVMHCYDDAEGGMAISGLAIEILEQMDAARHARGK